MLRYLTRHSVAMDDLLGHIAAVVIACGAALVFALMAWAGQHQS
jgi:hypothetical protein